MRSVSSTRAESLPVPHSGSAAASFSGPTLTRTLPATRSARVTSRKCRPARAAARTAETGRPRIPRRRTRAGRTVAPMRTLASAQPLTAASQPSRSWRGSASAIPIACASRTAADGVAPCSIRVRTWLVVLLSVPRKPSTRAPGRQRSTMLKMGAPSMTAASKRKRRPRCFASCVRLRYAKASGPLFAVTTWRRSRSAARTWATAGWPRRGSSGVTSTITSAGTSRTNAVPSASAGPRWNVASERPARTAARQRPSGRPCSSAARP